MKKILLSIFLSFAFYACTNNPQLEDELDKVASIMDSDAELAFVMLDSMSNEVDDMTENLRMRYYVLLADAQNKTDRQMLSDSLFHRVVDYYDQNGTANEQLKAHYLLGCVYRDLREAPIALQCYYDAIAKADTLSSDCDYRTLMCTWGQMAQLLFYQHMPEQQLAAFNNYSLCAKKLGDTYEYIRGIDLSTNAYGQMGDTATVARMTHELFKMYMDNGYVEAAYSVYPPLIELLVLQGRYDEARKYMDDYENKSGLFSNGELIVPEREMYYYFKGMYYCGLHKLDSAEMYLRKLLVDGESKYYGYKGLAQVYCERHNADSVIEMTQRQEMALDTLLSIMQMNAAQQASSMYDYSRMQRLAEENRAEAKFNALLLTFAIFVFIVVFVVLYFAHKRYVAHKEKELETLNVTYEKTKTEYVQAVENLTEQKEEYEQFKKDKLTEVADLKSKYNDLKSKDDEAMLLNTPFIIGIRDILKPFSPKPCMTNADIEELLLVVRQYLPHFYMEITKDDSLSQQELVVCILLRLNFTGKDLSVLLNTSLSSVANAKKRANEKLFGMGQANMLVQNLKNMGAEQE